MSQPASDPLAFREYPPDEMAGRAAVFSRGHEPETRSESTKRGDTRGRGHGD
jgi:hypothetical protein